MGTAWYLSHHTAICLQNYSPMTSAGNRLIFGLLAAFFINCCSKDHPSSTAARGWSGKKFRMGSSTFFRNSTRSAFLYLGRPLEINSREPHKKHFGERYGPEAGNRSVRIQKSSTASLL